MSIITRIVLSLSIFIASLPALAWSQLTADVDLNCTQAGDTRLDCDYRLLSSATAMDISAGSKQGSLDVLDRRGYPGTYGTTAILFVVDTSDPARQNVIEKNIEHIEKLVSTGRPHHRFGLASFDKNLRINAPVGSSGTRIINAAKTLQATGKTTELYRNVINAIETLAGVKADRRAIMLFSDGQAEDRAYFHQDVMKVARNRGVIINSLGYPRSVALSVALQTIRRMSEESGGIYVEADSNFNLPAGFLDDPFRNIDTGGKFSVDLAPLINSESPAQGAVNLSIKTPASTITMQVPYSNPLYKAAAVPVVVGSAAAATRDTTQQQGPPFSVAAPAQEPQAIDVWLWYGMPAGFLILIVLTVIILVVLYQQQSPSKSTADKSTNEYKPFAYLVVQDEKGIRYPIMNTTWRIGRTRDNELSLDDKSVSRRHAEIQRYSNGNFVIFDVDSLNGVFVNSEQIKKKRLQEGDIIEIGDIYLRFTTQAADYQFEEKTDIQNTRSPVTH